MKTEFFCDFDGTISLVDATNLILSRLADPEWLRIEDQWIRGEIGSRECLERQIPLIRGGWDAVLSVLSEVRLDPAFSGFAAACADRNIPLMIVSDGLDRVIRTLLKRENIKAEVRANELVEDAAGNFSVRFPHLPKNENCGAGVCKCLFLAEKENSLKIVIGDGQSDFCWVKKAHKVFAKSKLSAYCRKYQIPHIPFLNFASADFLGR